MEQECPIPQKNAIWAYVEAFKGRRGVAGISIISRADFEGL